ncbi:hypothetical protein LTR53_016827 [Teratosphaeriaceae sp. CCFEE 6253]|nr:hypothetical protein LTR53_016827 [Teratosphaeriaceae sp. CCFEE 6253]
MRPTHARPPLLLLLAATTATAQLLTNGNSQLPSCATGCALLQQAAQACGGTTTASQTIWSCFCQSGYLVSLYSSPSGICDASCTAASDNQRVMTWFTTNCGTDHGASEHADAGSGGGTTVVVITSTSTPASAATGAALPSTTASGGTREHVVERPLGKHLCPHPLLAPPLTIAQKWVVMLIVLFVALLLLALVAVWLKRRHDRKADQIREGFNTGITNRSAPMTVPSAHDGAHDASVSQIMSGGLEAGSGRDTPTRTRDGLMPYGHSLRSESRLSSRGHDIGGRKSPLARGGAPVGELEKDAGTDIMPDGAPPPKKTRRVLVRERSVEGPMSADVEKR